MKRIIYDVPRWSIFLHRAARGLDPVDRSDPPSLRFSDELFERVYSGNPEALPEADRDPAMRAWAERVHATCDQLPAFQRLAAECRGDADAAATAVETLERELQTELSEADLRRAARNGCARAAAAVEELRDATEGLEHVAFGRAPGSGSMPGEARDSPAARGLAMRLKGDPRLRRIAQLAGRFKRIAAAKRRSRVRHGVDEIADVEQGADLGRLLPLELARLVHPRLRLAMLRDLTERRCMQYALTGTETLGKGPLVVCLDKSGSMEGQPDIWATAVALALLEVAQHERRPFALLGFDAAVKFEAVVNVGDKLPDAGLFVACDGGTRIDNVVERGLDIIAQHAGALKKADIVLITDGGSNSDRAAELRARAVTLGVTILGVGIGIDASILTPWCDEAQVVSDLDRVDDHTADHLFGV